MSNVSDLTIEILKDIRDEMRGVRGELSELRNDVGELRDEVRETNKRLDDTNKRLDGTNKRLDNMIQFMGSHHTDHEQRITRIEKHLKLGRKPRA